MSETETETVGPETEPVEPEPEEEEAEETETETEPEGEPEAEPEATDDAETETEPEGRCEAETSVGGTHYRCSLDAGHEDEHSFQPVDTNDSGDPEQASLEAFQKSQKRVVGYVERYQKVLREEMGDEFDALTPCPLCPDWTPGFFFPGQVALMDDDQRIAVRLAIGDAELPSYQEDTHRHVCETCGGWGRVLTGSKRAQQDVLDCLDCAGKGYRSDQKARQEQQRQPEGEIVSGPWPLEAGQEPAPEQEPEIDPWGTPPGAPYYGVLLNFRPEGWEEEVAQYRAANGLG
jgi:hypothetical protein